MDLSKNTNNHIGRDLILTLYSRFLPAYYILEYNLKIKLFNIVKDDLGNAWFQTQLNDTTNDPLFKAEIDLIKKRKPRGYRLSTEKLVYESGFGLWVEFFNNRVYRLAKGRPIKIFEHLPKHIKRADIYQRLIKVKEFRNLLVHARVPLIADKSEIPLLDNILDNYKILLELLSWLGEMPVFSLAQFEHELNEIKNGLA